MVAPPRAIVCLVSPLALTCRLNHTPFPPPALDVSVRGPCLACRDVENSSLPSLFLRTSSPQSFPFRLNASTRAFKECDFDGRRRWQSKSTASTVTAAGCTTNSEDYIVIGGLEGPDRALRDLTATVHFQIDPAHKVEKAMGPIQARNSFFFHHVRCACVEAKAFLAELQEFHDYVQAVFSMRCASLSNAMYV